MALTWKEKLALAAVLLLYLVAGTMEFNDLKAMETDKLASLQAGKPMEGR